MESFLVSEHGPVYSYCVLDQLDLLHISNKTHLPYSGDGLGLTRNRWPGGEYQYVEIKVFVFVARLVDSHPGVFRKVLFIWRLYVRGIKYNRCLFAFLYTVFIVYETCFLTT